LTPRFIPWDLPGRCTRCKSATVEIDYVIQPQGVSIFSSRLTGGERFVGYDKMLAFPENAFIRLKARNRVMNLPLMRPELGTIPETSTDFNWLSFNKEAEKRDPQKENLEPGEIPPENNN